MVFVPPYFSLSFVPVLYELGTDQIALFVEIRPRICPGQQFALTEASYIIVRLLQRFGRLESRDDQPWIEKLSLTATSLNGAKVAMVA